MLVALGTRARGAEYLFLTGNILVLYSFVAPLSLATFFVLSALLIYIKPLMPARWRYAYLASACTILVGALIVYHRAAGIPAGEVPAVLILPLSGFWVPGDTSRLLSSIGASYCFLRAVYGVLEPRLELGDYARYFFFFPTYFSGPVITPQDYLAQTPLFSVGNLPPGLARIALGLVKVVISLCLTAVMPLTTPGGMVDVIQLNSMVWAWLYAFAVGVWLFLNFSGFSDVAIGVGRLCNIKVPENFNNPFAAADITDFWRRWHITLAMWLRACIFTPLTRALGVGFGHQHAALVVLPPLVTMIACGLWHGLSAPYVIWGALHGAGLVLHRGWKSAVTSRMPAVVKRSPVYTAASWALTHAYVALAWVFFFPTPTPSLLHSMLYTTRLFGVARYEVDIAISQAVAAIGLR